MGAFETKMVIVVRTDNIEELQGVGSTAKYVSEASIYAYQRGLEMHRNEVEQWEANSNPKIVVKAKNRQEIEEVAQKAKEKGVNYYLLQKNLTIAQKP